MVQNANIIDLCNIKKKSTVDISLKVREQRVLVFLYYMVGNEDIPSKINRTKIL